MSENQQIIQARNHSIPKQENNQNKTIQKDNQDYQLAQNNLNENPVIAIITIQLNENIFQNLEIRFNDEAGELAKQFCQQTNLDPQMIPILENNILEYKQIAIQDIYQKERDNENILKSQEQIKNDNIDSNQNGRQNNQIQGLSEHQKIQQHQIQLEENQEYTPAIKRVDSSFQANVKDQNKQNQYINQIKTQQNDATKQIKMQFPPPTNNVINNMHLDNPQLSNIAWVPERKSSNISENISVCEQQNSYQQSRGRAESFSNYSVANSQIYDQPQNLLKMMNSFAQNNFNNSLYQSSSIYFQKSNQKKSQQNQEMVKSRSQSLFNKSHNDCSFIQNTECTFKPTINPISEQIVQEKQKHLQRSSTHERLYEMGLNKIQQKDDSFDKKSARNERKSYNPSLNQSVQAITERLFNYSKRHQLQKQKDLQKSIQEKELKELQECTHKPQINEISQKLIMQKRGDPGRRIENELINQNKYSEKKKSIAKAKILEEEMKGCTFQPRINELSEYICNMKEQKDNCGNTENQDKQNKSKQQQRFEYLFEIGKQKSFQKSQPTPAQLIDKNCLFKPEINKVSQDIRSSFYERIQQYKVIRQEKEINQLRQKLNEFKDKQTGQPFFRPQTGRAPFKQRNQENLNVNEFLYQQFKIDSSRKEREILEKQKEKPQLQINDNSKKIVQQLEDTRLREIFNLLDDDQDGQIDSKNINITSISPKVLELISPVLYEMEDYHFQLNYEEFSQAIKRLAKGMTSQQKNDLFLYSKKQRESNHKSSNQNLHVTTGNIKKNSSSLSVNLKY
ncbi:hypothetical protein TTHERM_00666280 (macronuclear) [Tetrahymena thermophila SB210]|uniref:EF-hand domain-containing protein n=1 Tax=Tetrahymena thermophila (strain SB210) TaxID=312017 RepID=Q23TF4_TETTS|nr:hypothetical protein TTHERM_00666280 [Tetrahymena thermophila SB210]EAR99752.2 hypothetical protein TTHERM_00666280 [Tetrahymena thermophila SB210]|eukprot:XP_001019997.2 hypothetical protein TTHERM_00666280 [Tetrahymena thermophila SB210]